MIWREVERVSALLDPRPRIEERNGGFHLRGVRCSECGYVAPFARPLCPVCGGVVREKDFGPGGIVWSATVVRVPTPDRTPPYSLAYVDLDDGPRILAQVSGKSDEPLKVGARVRLTGLTEEGDVAVEKALK